MAINNIVERFSIPPTIPETDYDRRAAAGATILDFPFEDQRLTGYSWGAGKNVLLVHGWGSRASHLAPLGRVLARSGFRVVAYDAPAHGRSLKRGQENQSNLIEFCRAISGVARAMRPVYAVVGHSMGASATAFTIASQAIDPDYKFSTERLVMISSAASLSRTIENFCRRAGLRDGAVEELAKGLERNFDIRVAELSVALALKNINARVLIVHDRDDEEVPMEDALSLQRSRDDARFITTHGTGHQTILASRALIKAVKEFLIDTSES